MATMLQASRARLCSASPTVVVCKTRSGLRSGSSLIHNQKPCYERAALLGCRAVAEGPSDDGGATDYAQVAASLNALLQKSGTTNLITGRDLRDLVREKWGRSYDVRLTRLQGRMYLQVMWKFLEQASFPLSEVEYMQQLDAVAEYLTEWGVAATVRSGISSARKPPGYTGGGNARCVSIPLPVDLGGSRASEWQ